MKPWLWGVGIVCLGLAVVVINTQWQPPKPTASSTQKADPDIRIEILNGCGKDGIATQLGAQLRKHGFDVMTLGNADSYAFPETLVIDRVGKMHHAKQVANILGTQNLIQQITPDPFRIEGVTIIVGRDYAHLPILKNQKEARR